MHPHPRDIDEDDDEPEHYQYLGQVFRSPKTPAYSTKHIERPDVVGNGDECEPSQDRAANPAAHHVEKKQRDGESHEVVAVA